MAATAVSTPGTGTRSAMSSGSAHSGKLPPAQRRRIRQVQEKRIGDDEFMAAAIGDLQWLKQSQKSVKGEVNYDRNGMAAIHLSAIHGRLECLKYFIEVADVDVNLPSKNGWRAIHLVISNQTGKRAFECLQYILQKGANPSICNDDGITPVHQAASEGHIPCLKALLEVGAKVNTVDYRGHTPLDLAKLWGHRKCARILAAAEWHQDKAFLAQEVNSLNRLKMQQLNEELELAKQLYGENRTTAEQSYQDWLQQHSLKGSESAVDASSSAKTKPHLDYTAGDDDSHAYVGDKEKSDLGPDVQRSAAKSATRSEMSLQTKKSSGKTRSTTGGYQANSVVRQDVTDVGETVSQPSTTRTEIKTQVVTKESVEKKSAKSTSRIPMSGTHTEASFGLLRTVTDDGDGQTQDKLDTSKADAKPKESTTAVSGAPWNPSTKVNETFGEYMPKLPDYYPRDEFTMLPKPPIKRRPPRPKSRDVAISRATSAGFSHITDEDIAEAFDARPNDRVTVFKCHTVTDIPKRKSADVNSVYRDESGLHLTTNIKSWLFRNGLLPHLVPLWESVVMGDSKAVTDNNQAVVVGDNKSPDEEPAWDCLW